MQHFGRFYLHDFKSPFCHPQMVKSLISLLIMQYPGNCFITDFCNYTIKGVISSFEQDSLIDAKVFLLKQKR